MGLPRLSAFLWEERGMVKIFGLGLLALQLFIVPLAWADSLVDIPKGTVFELLEELEIPANRDFALLGQSALDEAFNSTGQILNDQTGRPLNAPGNLASVTGYLTFYRYYNRLFESYEATYLNCLERHRIYARMPGSVPSTAVVVQQGHGNVAIVNQGRSHSDEIYSAIGENSCIPPNHTVAALVIDRKKAQGGGFFAEGYRFKVRDVRWQAGRYYHVVTITFDHEIVQGLVVVTTHDPETIPMSALSGEHSTAEGFWASVGESLVDMTRIGGDYFSIELPEKHYYE